MIKEVLRLKLQAGLSHQRIAQALRISKDVVVAADNYLERSATTILSG